ncbi:polymorphic toxin-type HINT domain-containing protein [Fangia hongkongensis]|uniref:polymorphic toxin-type HINT domain-containing protein n=1 Tax=Fangia hongkongensis TaxID=270495 RepID=UPI0003783A1B|nr:polymorphic toxin-type HINT domain-containing protein [Fangia hongkongensis]MBK2125240.1 hypothetical protein [Fangia hongkongensis]
MNLSFNKVTQMFSFASKCVVRLDIEQHVGENENVYESVYCTKEHPIYIKDRGFVSIDVLSQLRATSHIGISVEREKVMLYPQGNNSIKLAPVYNVEVNKAHTYFVGNAGVWVHNTCDGMELSHIAVHETSVSERDRAGSFNDFNDPNVLTADIWRRIVSYVPFDQISPTINRVSRMFRSFWPDVRSLEYSVRVGRMLDAGFQVKNGDLIAMNHLLPEHARANLPETRELHFSDKPLVKQLMDAHEVDIVGEINIIGREASFYISSEQGVEKLSQLMLQVNPEAVDTLGLPEGVRRESWEEFMAD